MVQQREDENMSNQAHRSFPKKMSTVLSFAISFYLKINNKIYSNFITEIQHPHVHTIPIKNEIKYDFN